MPGKPMRVLITQPVQDAAAVASELQARGHHALTIPMVNVERTAPPAIKLEGAQGFIVTSPDGARALADTIGVRTFPVFADSQVTEAELKRRGFKDVKSAKDDSADLAKLIERNANPNYGAFIYACSTSAPVQLSALLSNMGFAVRSLPLYEIKRVNGVPPDLRRALENNSIDVALFLSADEARAFVQLIQREQLEPLVRNLKTVAANPVVAAPLRALKVGAVAVPPAGDLETIFSTLDGKIVDKVEEERLERERIAREEAQRKAQEEERLTKKRAEEERLTREKAERERTERERLAREQEDRERAAREQAEQARIAKEKAAAEKAEQKRLAQEHAAREKEARKQAERERAEQARAEKERMAQEKAERERNAREQAEKKKAERARIEKEKAEAEAREREEHDRQEALKRANEESERRRREELRAEQQRKADEEEQARIRAAAAETAEQERLRAEADAKEQELRRHEEEKRRADEEEERERQESIRIELERKAAEEAARKQAAEVEAARERAEREAAENAVREKLAREKAEQERMERERRAAEEAERQRLEKERKDQEDRERAEKLRAEKEAKERERREAEAKRRAQDEAERAERERAAREKKERIQAEKARKAEQARQKKEEKIAAQAAAKTAAAASAGTAATAATTSGLASKFLSWFSNRNTPEMSRPMFTSFPDGPVPKQSQKPDVAEKIPSATMEPQVAVTAAAPEPESVPDPAPLNKDQDKLPQLEETRVVSQETPQEPAEDPNPANADRLPPSSPTPRSGGRAERLRAEDAADQRAREQRYKNFDIGDAAADSKAHAAEQTASAPAATKSRGGVGRVVGLFVFLVIAATAIIGTASWWVPRVFEFAGNVTPVAGDSSEPAPMPEPAPSPGESTTEQATAESPPAQTPSPPPQGAAELQARIDALEEQLSGSLGADDLAALNKRLDALQRGGGIDDGSVNAMSESISSQARQLAAVSARLATLEAAIGNAARLEDLNNRITVLEGKSADAASVLSLSERITVLEETSRRAVAEQTAEVALLMSAVQLREAVTAGQPFVSELETARALSARVLNERIDDDAFSGYAARGIPTLNQLQQRFGPMAARAIRADVIPEAADGWLRQSLDRLLSIVNVRRVDGDAAGDSVSAVMARAESRLSNGDITAAAAELEALTGASADAAAPWMADARARTAVDKTVSGIMNHVLSAMAAEDGAQTSAGGGE